MIEMIRKAWANDALWIDTLIAGLLVVGVFKLLPHLNLGAASNATTRSVFLSTVSAGYCSILGFNVTAVSILALVSQSESIKLLREQRPVIYRRLLGTFASTIWAALVAVIVPLVALVLFEPVGLGEQGIIITSFCAILGFARLSRSVHRLFALLSLS